MTHYSREGNTGHRVCTNSYYSCSHHTLEAFMCTTGLFQLGCNSKQAIKRKYEHHSAFIKRYFSKEFLHLPFPIFNNDSSNFFIVNNEFDSKYSLTYSGKQRMIYHRGILAVEG